MSDPGTAAYRAGEPGKRQTLKRSSAANIITRLARILFLTVFSFLMSAAPLMGLSFPGASAAVTCTSAYSRRSIFLMIPAAAALILRISRGADAYGDLAAMAVCGVVFAAAAKTELKPMHRALIAACIFITCQSIYRLASSTLYRTGTAELLLGGLAVLCLVFIFDSFLKATSAAVPYNSTAKGYSKGDHFPGPDVNVHQGKSRSGPYDTGCEQGADIRDPRTKAGSGVFMQDRYSSAAGMVSLASLPAVFVMAVCGADLTFMTWIVVTFLSMWSLAYLPAEKTMIVVLAGGVTAALAGQTQWGIMVSLLTGTAAASFIDMIASGVRPAGDAFSGKISFWKTETGTQLRIAASAAVFIIVCSLLCHADEGLVLGVDIRTLLTAAVVFLPLNLKCSRGMERILRNFAYPGRGFHNEAGMAELAGARAAELFLRESAAEMSALEELYSTYLDRRSILANQFDMSSQIFANAADMLRSRAGRRSKEQNFKFDADIAASQCAALGGINGDCCGWQDIGDGRIAIVLSDGMGKGKKAATESLMVVRTVLSLLRAGVSTDMTIKTINTVMLMKDDGDSFATLDLAIIDRKTGIGRFYKIGAAPTLLRRRENIEEMKLSAVPLGIVNGLKVRYMETSLKCGDWIIMMSDGVSDGGRETSIIEDISRTAVKIRSGNPQVMSDLILDQASDSYALRERDDLTVIVARLNPEEASS